MDENDGNGDDDDDDDDDVFNDNTDESKQRTWNAICLKNF